MAMGVVSDDDFLKEVDNTSLSRPKPIAKTPIATVVDKPIPGRKEGDVNVPNALREVIGEASFSDGRTSAVDLAQRFGISPSSVSAYSKGATSTASYDETPNTSVIAKSRVRVQKRAMGRLMQALQNLTPEKLAETKARDLAGIAKDMSAVVKQMEPEVEGPDKTKDLPQFLVYAPQFRDERSFDVIYAKE